MLIGRGCKVIPHYIYFYLAEVQNMS